GLPRADAEAVGDVSGAAAFRLPAVIGERLWGQHDDAQRVLVPACAAELRSERLERVDEGSDRGSVVALPSPLPGSVRPALVGTRPEDSGHQVHDHQALSGSVWLERATWEITSAARP